MALDQIALCVSRMTFKIEIASDGQATTVRLIGRIDWQSLDELHAHLRMLRPRVVLDLDEVTLVDVAIVHFLIACEALAIELLHCPPYIRDGWIASLRTDPRTLKNGEKPIWCVR